MTINFSGLATGLDTASIIDQLVSIEKAPANSLREKKTDTTRQNSIVGDLISKLKALSNKAKEFDTADEVRAVASTSSDETRVKITASGAATAGAHDVRVLDLARAKVNTSQNYLTNVDGVAGVGSVDFTVDGVTTNVAFGAADNLDDIAARINDDVDGVQASVLNTGTGFKLVVRARESGTDKAPTFVENGSALGLNANPITAASNARLKIDGVQIERSTNLIADALTGVTLDLRGIHAADPLAEPDTIVSVTADPAASKTKLQAFVDSYNAVIDGLNAQLGYAGTTKGADTLFGDSTLRSLQRRMASIAGAQYTHEGEDFSLGMVGLKLEAGGKLSIDATKLEKAIADHPGALEHVLAGEDGGEGLTQKLAQLAKEFATGGVDQHGKNYTGLLVAKQTSYAKLLKDYDAQITKIEDRAEKTGVRLTSQFTELENLISGLKTQQSYLSALFNQ